MDTLKLRMRVGKVFGPLLFEYFEANDNDPSHILDKIVEEVERTSEWVSVEDRLPERVGDYIFGGYDSDGDWVFDKYYVDIRGFVNGWNKDRLKQMGNTHWLEFLPTPPKGDE